MLKVASAGVAALAVTGLIGGVAMAAKPAAVVRSVTLLGNDISWPQCNKRLPGGQAFGIVGVNDGLANTTNPCFAAELSWANTSSGGTGQPSAALYVNTANPGHQGTWWPASNDYGGSTVANPYGTCTGNVDTACAYMYGYAKAYDDATIRGVPSPASYLWWLDVETANTWQTDKTANAADLEGMTAYFQSIGASAGLYSTNYQWGQIVGAVATSSPLNSLKSWLAGASSQSSAKTMCSAASPLTSGSQVVLTQFVSKNLDYDYSCI
jgi:hypothetical protein